MDDEDVVQAARLLLGRLVERMEADGYHSDEVVDARAFLEGK